MQQTFYFFLFLNKKKSLISEIPLPNINRKDILFSSNFAFVIWIMEFSNFSEIQFRFSAEKISLFENLQNKFKGNNDYFLSFDKIKIKK